MSFEFILGLVGTITGIVGTAIGLTNLILRRIREKPRLKISDVMVSLQDKRDKVRAEVSFKVDNVGDRSTTIHRINVMLGPDVEVIEELRMISANSSIRIPEKPDSSISFDFPKDVEFLDGTQELYFEREEKLRIIILFTHDSVERTYRLPASSEWEKQSLYKGGPTVLLLG